MTEKIFKPKDVLDLFEIKTITKQSLLNYEEKGEIPKAHRDQKTKIAKILDHWPAPRNRG